MLNMDPSALGAETEENPDDDDDDGLAVKARSGGNEDESCPP